MLQQACLKNSSNLLVEREAERLYEKLKSVGYRYRYADINPYCQISGKSGTCLA